MPAHRKQRPKTEEDLKQAVISECLARLEQAFPAESYAGHPIIDFDDETATETWPGWTEKACRSLYTTSLRHLFPDEDEDFLRLYGLWKKMRAQLLELQAACENIEARGAEGRQGELAHAIKGDLFPLERFCRAFSDEAVRYWTIHEQLHREEPQRKAFIKYTDGFFVIGSPITTHPKAWGWPRWATDKELAMVALAAGDFPPLNVGDDMPSKVIIRMTKIMRTERSRLWKQKTGGRLAGPNKPADSDGQEP